MSEVFALVRPTEDAFDAALAARLVSPILDCNPADLQQSMLRSPGFPVRKLDRARALEASQRLCEAGVKVVAVPESEVIDPPPPTELTGGTLLEGGFQFRASKEEGTVRWDRLAYFDVAHVQQVDSVVDDEWRLPENPDDPDDERTVPTHRTVTKWLHLIDIVAYEPWCRLRITDNRFRYINLGIPQHANRQKNYMALAIAIRTRSPAAKVGPGFDLMFDGDASTRQRVKSMRLYEHLLQWRLTRIATRLE
jgi:hypothetical protein